MDNKDSSSDNVEQQAKIKRLLKIFWATEAALAVATIQRLFNPNWSIIIATSLAAILMLPVYFLAKNGKTDLASNILLLLLTVLLLGFVWTFGGLRDEVLLVFPAIIMVSLLIGSNRLALYIYLLVGTLCSEFGLACPRLRQPKIPSLVLIASAMERVRQFPHALQPP